MSEESNGSRVRRIVSLLLSLLALLLTSTTRADDQLNLAALHGKVVYLDFWASWCAPCRKSFPWMDSTQRAYAGRGLVIVAVNLDEDRAPAEDFLREFNPGFRIVFDSKGALAEAFKVSGMPSSFLLDRNGNVRYRHVGFKDDSPAALTDELSSLLAEP
jgi:thiol-disulfide isomerase/thioredoxin